MDVAAVNGAIHIVIADYGAGGVNVESGSGLRGRADRVAAVGGSLRIESPQGAGTRIEVDLPCE